MSDTAVIDSEPGWSGLFTRAEAPGAFRNGTLVRKVGTEQNDAHRDGAPAIVLGSIRAPELGIGYFVEWLDLPLHACFVAHWRIKPV